MKKNTRIIAVLFLALVLCLSSCSGCPIPIKLVIGDKESTESTAESDSESASESGSETEEDSSESDRETDDSSKNESEKKSSEKEESASKEKNDGKSASGGSKEKSEEESSEEKESTKSEESTSAKESSSEKESSAETKAAEHVHTFDHIAKVDATCIKDGNIEYWRCTGCSKCYKDSAGKNYIEKPADLVLKALGHDPLFSKGYTPSPLTCLTEGTYGKYVCTRCGKEFLDAECKTEVKSESDLKYYGPHTMVHKGKVDPSCDTAGNKDHWECSVCLKLFEDGEGKVEIKDPALAILYPLGHDLKHISYAMKCETKGCKDHYECSRCGKYFWDKDAAVACTPTDVELAPAGHDYVDIAYVAPGCETEGKEQHRECKRCGKNFKWDYTEVADPSVFNIPPAGHYLSYYSEDYPCYDGYHEHYACPICNQWFAMDKTTKVSMSDLFFKGTGHNYQEVHDGAGKRIYHSDGMRWLFRCNKCGDEVYLDPKG